jgi:hypothetical protein
MAGPTYYPAPTGLAPLEAPLTVNTTLTFGVGSTTDRAAKLVADFADILYDQVETISVDVGISAAANDISTPSTNLVTIYKPVFDPASAYVVGILLTCEFGEAALYFATDVTKSDYFAPPDVDSVLPLPLIPGGWLLYVNDQPYDIAESWQTEDHKPIYLGEIMAATFKPSRITGYVFLKNIEV